MSNSTGSIRLDLINGNMPGLVDSIACDEIETLTSEQFGEVTIARKGCSVLLLSPDGSLAVHGHTGIVGATDCYQRNLDLARQELEKVTAMVAALDSIPAGERAMLETLADQVMSGRMDLNTAKTAMAGYKAMASQPTDHVGMYV